MTSEKKKPECFGSYDDGSTWKRGVSRCLSCEYRLKCEKKTPKSELITLVNQNTEKKEEKK